MPLRCATAIIHPDSRDLDGRISGSLAAFKFAIWARFKKLRSDSFWKDFATHPILLFQKMRGWLRVTEMLCWAAGGPQKYTGKDMESSQRHLRITPGVWDAFMDDVAQTLDKFAVPLAERAEVVAIVESTRAAIVV